MLKPRKIVGRRIIRREGETDDEYLAAARRHLQTIQFGRANLLRIAMERSVASIGITDEVSPQALTDIAGALLKVLDEFQCGTASAFVDLRREIGKAQADNSLSIADVVDTEPAKLAELRALSEFGLQTDDLAWEFPDARPEIARRPGVMSGDWVVWGTRIRPEVIEAEIAAGRTEEQILEAYPTLPKGVVAAVQRWLQHIDLITAHDPGVVEVLDYTPVDLSSEGHAPIAFLVLDESGIHGGWVGATAPEYMVREPIHEGHRLANELLVMIETRKRKQEIADEDLNWSEWQQRVDTPLPGHLKATGSGDLQVDLGYAQPGKTRLLVDLIRVLRAEIDKRHLTSDEVAVAAGMKSEEIDVLLRGVVRGRDVYDVLWILSRLGKRISIEIEDATDGGGYIVVEHGN